MDVFASYWSLFTVLLVDLIYFEIQKFVKSRSWCSVELPNFLVKRLKDCLEGESFELWRWEHAVTAVISIDGWRRRKHGNRSQAATSEQSETWNTNMRNFKFLFGPEEKAQLVCIVRLAKVLKHMLFAKGSLYCCKKVPKHPFLVRLVIIERFSPDNVDLEKQTHSPSKCNPAQSV